jgi:hypothetical protein
MITNGYHVDYIELDFELINLIKKKDYNQIDLWAKHQLESGFLKQFLCQFYNYTSFEYILALRDANDPDQEDGIWHDDGSRYLAFSLSLNLEHKNILGGELLIRKKMSSTFHCIPSLKLGGIIIFQTGQHGFEHKITQVTSGQRLVLAGWLN